MLFGDSGSDKTELRLHPLPSVYLALFIYKAGHVPLALSHGVVGSGAGVIIGPHSHHR